MLSDYLPILFYTLFAAGFVGAAALAAEVLGRRVAAPGKFSTYECGMTPVGTARVRLSLHFYVIAVLFILFDAEAAFLLPWAVVAKKAGLAGFLSVALFLGLAGAGLAVAWKKGALEWER
ncbi:MAG: NADH-quinone oxidoreductase subunit A [Planctomycetota bacterium]